jgi:general secretion pathway protein G
LRLATASLRASSVAAGRTQSRGYTLLELVMVLGLLGVLAMMVLPVVEMNARRDKERELRRALWEIRGAIDAYHRTVARTPGDGRPVSGYPPSLRILSEGVVDPHTGQARYFLRRIPRDPFADERLPAEETWALRSHDSPPDRPAPGADVFDVASRSPLVGLNGVPLKAW